MGLPETVPGDRAIRREEPLAVYILRPVDTFPILRHQRIPGMAARQAHRGQREGTEKTGTQTGKYRQGTGSPKSRLI